MRSAVAVHDLRTGRFWGAGDLDAYYGAASVMKLFVATKLLLTGQMYGPTATRPYSMITRSDNQAVVALLPKVGGTSVVNWVAQHYGIARLGYPPLASRDWCWGNTHISARGLVHFYGRMRADPRVAPWLLNAMHHYTAIDSDGFDQRFGLPSATGGTAIKQGEGHCSSDSNGSIVHTTGIVGGDRYAIAILTESHICCDAGGFNGTLAGIVTAMARTLLPRGFVDLPETHNPFGRVDSVTARGSTVTITGWGIDPDTRNSPSPVRVTEGGTTRWAGSMTVLRPDVNAAQHTAGNHGFVARFAATDGRHTYCTYLRNVLMGNADNRQCYSVQVDGRPRGHLAEVTPSVGAIAVSGWAYDPDSVPGPSPVRITLDAGTAAAASSTTMAGESRPSGTYPVPGSHGFSGRITTTPGAHRVCAVAVNVGAGSSSATLGCVTATIPAPGPPAPRPRPIPARTDAPA